LLVSINSLGRDQSRCESATRHPWYPCQASPGATAARSSRCTGGFRVNVYAGFDSVSNRRPVPGRDGPARPRGGDRGGEAADDVLRAGRRAPEPLHGRRSTRCSTATSPPWTSSRRRLVAAGLDWRPRAIDSGRSVSGTPSRPSTSLRRS